MAECAAQAPASLSSTPSAGSRESLAMARTTPGRRRPPWPPSRSRQPRGSASSSSATSVSPAAMSAIPARGSSAFGGAVDIVLAVRRPDNGSQPTVRVLGAHALSRFDETPNQLLIELTPRGYEALGDEAAVAHRTALEAVLSASAAQGPVGLTTEDLRDRTRLPRTTVQGALDALRAEDKIDKLGRGVRGDPCLIRACGRTRGQRKHPGRRTGYPVPARSSWPSCCGAWGRTFKELRSGPMRRVLRK